jgi:hypothetical protein
VPRDRPAAGALLHGLREYRGEPHRVEWVATIDDVEYFDDSKGTNVGATVAALSGLDKHVVLIAGGDGKGQDFSPLVAPVAQYARAVVLIGRTRARCARRWGDRQTADRRRLAGRSGGEIRQPRGSGRRGAAVAGLRQPRHVPQLRPSRPGVPRRGGRTGFVPGIMP